MQDDLRAELIKQFPSEVIETKDMTGKEYYACPTCKRAVATGTEKCQGCGQKLSWDNIRHENEEVKKQKSSLMFRQILHWRTVENAHCPTSEEMGTKMFTSVHCR